MKRKLPKIHLTFEAENLAVPEVHTGTVEKTSAPRTVPDPGTSDHITVKLDDVAVPEVHISE